jgi:hypothetical protein
MENELDETIRNPQRKLIVSKKEIILGSSDRQIENNGGNNIIFVLFVEESKGSAGGRGGGSGSRRLERIIGFETSASSSSSSRPNSSNIKKFFETRDQEIIERFDIPYSAVAMDIVLTSGESFVVQGIVDNEMIESYLELTDSIKS